MSRQITIYFDTCFYVWLSRVEESLATQIVSDLNTLNVRHVISGVILRELLSCGNKPDFDKALVRRVRQFRIAPYHIGHGLAWEALLFSGQDRIDCAASLAQLHDRMTKAESLSIMAPRATSEEETAEILEANRDALDGFGFPDDTQQNLPQALSAAKSMLDAFGVSGLDWPENPTPEDLLRVPNKT